VLNSLDRGPGGRRAAVDVLVIGAGVIGLSTAVSLAEAGLGVRVDAAAPPARTTSYAAGAVWEPYLVQPRRRVLGWSERTLRELTVLSGAGADNGVRMVEGGQQSRLPGELPFWARLVGARWCEPHELRDGDETT
jgi:D-amino-acid oxidase